MNDTFFKHLHVGRPSWKLQVVELLGTEAVQRTRVAQAYLARHVIEDQLRGALQLVARLPV